ncbi:RNA 3'-terminal phosphate cyclase-like [Oscarella lobularis]|uniref:RNA 3'-terminal phosphate cyclase-like n=1 Tax=Oscarella lobularis TaxID=121494 RepID=UPI0033133E14
MNSSCSKDEAEPSSQSDSSESQTNSEHDDVNSDRVDSDSVEEIEKTRTRDSADPIVIDASNAGGQVLRIANTLFFFTKKPITVTNIRGHHGLRESHTHQVDMVVTMSNGRAEGNEEGSVEYTLWPSDAKTTATNKTFSFESDWEFLTTFQAVLPCFAFGREKSTFRWCGEELDSSLCLLDYVYFCQSILRPVLEKFGVHFDVVASGPDEIEEMIATVDAVKELKSVTMTSCDGDIDEIRATIFHSGQYNDRDPRTCAQEFEWNCIRILKEIFGTEVVIHCKTKYRMTYARYWNPPRSSIILEIITSDECILTAERFSWSPSWNFSYEESDSVDDAERIVRNLALDCKRAYGNRVCVRDHLTDQILLFMALAKGTSTIRSDYPLPDDHWKKAISVIEELLDVKFSVRIEDEFIDISCEGIGMQNENF